MVFKLTVAVLAAAITAHPLANDEVLEPSIVNEVVHALDRAPANPPPADVPPVPTNGLSATQIAIRIVSAQREDGRWYCGTNDVTSAAVAILKRLAECSE